MNVVNTALLLLNSLAPQQPTCRTSLWDVPAIDPSNNDTGGWPLIPTASRVKLWDGVEHGRTYSHHPIIERYNDTIVMIWTSAEVDEDALGQEIMGSMSTDKGSTWSEPVVVVPKAMLPNQTNEHDFSYWCSENIAQRAWQSEAIIQSPASGVVYAVADSTCFLCSPDSTWNVGAGRVARPLNLDTGEPTQTPCWLSRNHNTHAVGFDDTLYGSVPYCEELETINEVLAQPENVPAWSAVLYNRHYYGAVEGKVMEEPTHAVRSGYSWERFWRDVTPDGRDWSAWIECTQSPGTWFPNDTPLSGDEAATGLHAIYETDIPNAQTKQYFGTVSAPENIRYLVSNPRTHDTHLDRFPLTIAWQGLDDGDDWTFKHIAVVHTHPDPNIAPETREQYKNLGFSYPSAVQVGDQLFIAYSENKQNIWVTSVPIEALRR